ncbi:MAG: right-handed parallel beta-helix repeat-containing protein [Leadbetterella sp.]|jgi:hypothetical protein|nr:right-handed parallel beta-helix repeat-containing protein [Leadbetterella sp.]
MKNLLFLTVFTAIFVVACTKEETTDITPVVKPDELSVSGEVSGTWKKSSIITVKGDIIIPAGKTLTIEEGVSIVMDTTSKPEVIVNGNLYAIGSTANPIKFSVPEGAKLAKYKFGQLWGGILAAKTCTELLLDNVIMEYGGAVTTEASTSVKLGLYKAASGEFDPALWFSNTSGKLVVRNTTIRNWRDDATYIEGGSVIFANNTFYTTGLSGGDGINIKSGVIADVAFNLIYSTNTNALKLSSTGGRTPQAYVVAYNNTILNTGWRRPTAKGGSIWVEQSVRADLYNNLMANCRFGIKRDTKLPEDTRSVVSNNFYYGYTQTAVDQFQSSKEILAGKNDVIGTKANENDPKFVNYPTNTDILNSDFNSSWDFHLSAGSPALGKGITTFTRNFKDGITINGVLYKSPEPTTYVGAFGTK